MGLEARRSIRGVAEQLLHSNPELTLRTYAHALPVEEQDLAFADFGGRPKGSGRLYTAPSSEPHTEDTNALDATARGRSGIQERETGVEPVTLGLGS